MKGQGNKKEKSFEEALSRLEEIVFEMEGGELKLDAMLKKFDEGMRLAKFCSRKLEEAEKKIEVLIKKENGGSETQEFLPSRETRDSEGPEESLSRKEEASGKEGHQDEEPLF